jgi:hypothetical protein
MINQIAEVEEQANERGNIEIELTDEEFLQVAKMAHENDITFNKMVERILVEYMERLKKE